MVSQSFALLSHASAIYSTVNGAPKIPSYYDRIPEVCETIGATKDGNTCLMSHDGTLYWYRPVFDSDESLGVVATAVDASASNPVASDRACRNGECGGVASVPPACQSGRCPKGTLPKTECRSGQCATTTAYKYTCPSGRCPTKRAMPCQSGRCPEANTQGYNCPSGNCPRIHETGCRSARCAPVPSASHYSKCKSGDCVRSPRNGSFLKDKGAPVASTSAQAAESQEKPALLRTVHKASNTKVFGTHSDGESPVPKSMNGLRALPGIGGAASKKPNLARESRNISTRVMEKISRESQHPPSGVTTKSRVGREWENPRTRYLETTTMTEEAPNPATVVKGTGVVRESQNLQTRPMEESNITRKSLHPTEGLVTQDAATEQNISGSKFQRKFKKEIMCNNGTCRLINRSIRKDEGPSDGRVRSPPTPIGLL